MNLSYTRLSSSQISQSLSHLFSVLAGCLAFPASHCITLTCSATTVPTDRKKWWKAEIKAISLGELLWSLLHRPTYSHSISHSASPDLPNRIPPDKSISDELNDSERKSHFQEFVIRLSARDTHTRYAFFIEFDSTNTTLFAHNQEKHTLCTISLYRNSHWECGKSRCVIWESQSKIMTPSASEEEVSFLIIPFLPLQSLAMSDKWNVSLRSTEFHASFLSLLLLLSFRELRFVWKSWHTELPNIYLSANRVTLTNINSSYHSKQSHLHLWTRPHSVQGSYKCSVQIIISRSGVLVRRTGGVNEYFEMLIFR